MTEVGPQPQMRMRSSEISYRTRPRPSSRAGQAAGVAVCYGGVGLLLAWFAGVIIYAGVVLQQPQRLALGIVVAAGAVACIAYASFLTRRALAEGRAVRGCNRPGEKVIGLFEVTLMRRTDGNCVEPVEPVTLIVSNQRLFVHPSPRKLEVPAEQELADITSVQELGTRPGLLQQRVLLRAELVEGPELLLRMTLSTAHEFGDVKLSHMTPSPRRVRAVVVAAAGPTPAKPEVPLADMLDGGKPVLYQFVLAENYLRIISDRPRPMADLWWYFHWEHMRVDAVEDAGCSGLPADWGCLRLTSHELSWMIACAPADDIRRLRDKAAAGGAQTPSIAD